MARSISRPAPKLTPPEPKTWTLQLRTITPMFGGSATPREVDAENPIRAASVRGHLRFWWRATAGPAYSNSKKLFEDEERIWGSAEKQGAVSLWVEVLSKGKEEPCCTYVHKGGEVKTYPNFGKYPGYALFPFQGKARRDRRTREIFIEEEPAKCIPSLEFCVRLSCPKELETQVWPTVWAWIEFGGIGARTRRGCGSLQLVKVEPEVRFKPIAHLLHQPEQLTTLPARYFVRELQTDALSAWKAAVDCYRDFRQAEYHARERRTDPKKPAGRSMYPEADTIRRLFPREGWKHSPKHPVNGFPRADLGLPIGFHFTEEGPDESFTFEPDWDGHKRFASPVITKAIRVEEGYVPAILILQSPHVWSVGKDFLLKLDQHVKHIPRPQVDLASQSLEEIPSLGGKPIREALVEYVLSKDYKEVRL